VKTLIKNGYVYDPGNGREGRLDILIESGKIARVAKKLNVKTDRVVDAGKMVVLPGLVDMHAHLREPGREDAETIASGLSAAATGGFTSVCVMPNTEPCCDNEGTVRFMKEKASQARLSNLFVIGAITKGRRGEALAEIGELKEAGCIAISDDGNSVEDASLMRRALEYSMMFDIPVISHCEDKRLSGDGVMNEGYVSTTLGLQGIPNAAESTIVARDLELAAFTGARLHIAHVSCRESVELIKAAKSKGVRVTCETCPHYLVFTDEDLRAFDTSLKTYPPLRTAEDRQALRAAAMDGTIDAIATDHAPHIESEKEVEFDYAPFGITGLETAVSALLTFMLKDRPGDWRALAELMSLHPAKIIGEDKGTLGEGKDADITIIDPVEKWVYGAGEIKSKSKNSPFLNTGFTGRVKYTIVGGRIVYGE